MASAIFEARQIGAHKRKGKYITGQYFRAPNVPPDKTTNLRAFYDFSAPNPGGTFENFRAPKIFLVNTRFFDFF